MKRISSVTTYFRKKIIPLILSINIFIVIPGLIYFDFSFGKITLVIFPTIIFAMAWLFSYKRLKIVYLGDKLLIVDSVETIFFLNIIAIEKISMFQYKVTYKKDNENKCFIFMVDYLPFMVPYFVKEINEFIKKRF